MLALEVLGKRLTALESLVNESDPTPPPEASPSSLVSHLEDDRTANLESSGEAPLLPGSPPLEWERRLTNLEQEWDKFHQGNE